MKIEEDSLFFLIIRLIIAIIFIYHGYGKIINVENWTSYLVSKNVPSFLGFVSAWFEFIIGILLLLGIFTRLSSLGLIIFMIIAILIAHINDPVDTYFYQIGIILCGIIVLLGGGGKYSLDNFL